MRKTKVVGHRGASGYAPENTILSFQKAIDLGCDKTELDVRLSKDNELIVIHDPEVDRISNGQGEVSKMTLTEIRKLKCLKNQKIPFLQEVIDLCKDRIDLLIELKAEGTPEKVNQIILENQFLDQVLVISFELDLIKEIKELNPEIKTGFLFKEDNKRLWDLAETVPFDYICPKSSLVNQVMVNKAHDLGLKVYAYEVNKKKLADYLIELGVDEIGTDFPKLFIRVD